MNKNLVNISVIKKKINHLPYNVKKKISSVNYSKAKNKKYSVVYDGKTINFGHKLYEDYLIHKDNNRRKRYRLRHRNDKIKDPSKPGYYSWHILW